MMLWAFCRFGEDMERVRVYVCVCVCACGGVTACPLLCSMNS
jgi:hypothetical protein